MKKKVAQVKRLTFSQSIQGLCGAKKKKIYDRVCKCRKKLDCKSLLTLLSRMCPLLNSDPLENRKKIRKIFYLFSVKNIQEKNMSKISVVI